MPNFKKKRSGGGPFNFSGAMWGSVKKAVNRKVGGVASTTSRDTTPRGAVASTLGRGFFKRKKY